MASMRARGECVAGVCGRWGIGWHFASSNGGMASAKGVAKAGQLAGVSEPL